MDNWDKNGCGGCGGCFVIGEEENGGCDPTLYNLRIAIPRMVLKRLVPLFLMGCAAYPNKKWKEIEREKERKREKKKKRIII